MEGDKALIEANLKQIQQHGVPNYFGPQRFGHDGGNVEQGPSTSIGLENVRKRLETLYDNAAHLYLKTNHPHGVIAELRLPADKK